MKTTKETTPQKRQAKTPDETTKYKRQKKIQKNNQTKDTP